MANPFPVDDAALPRFAKSILDDYEAVTSPFQPRHLPEKKVIDDINNEKDRTLFVTFVSAVDYRKETAGETGLWQVMKRLWENERWPFEPAEVVNTRPYQRIIDLFEERPIMDWQDPHIWFRNALTFHRDFGNDPRKLFAEHHWNAQDTLRYMRDNGRDFPYLKGKKISSLWLRLIHEEVRQLRDIHEIAIPVDSHIRPLSKRLIDFDKPDSVVSDGDIRERWTDVCAEINTYPVRLDQPLWLIEKNWNEWGEPYLREKIESLEG